MAKTNNTNKHGNTVANIFSFRLKPVCGDETAGEVEFEPELCVIYSDEILVSGTVNSKDKKTWTIISPKLICDIPQSR